MGIALTREQVVALAPDAASAKAASGLTSDGKWTTLGADAEAVWGECQGSGSKPYQAQVDLHALVARCSCPSRKFPCKHGLALLLLYAQGNPRFAAQTRPGWVEEWLASRRDRAEKKEKAAEAAVSKAAADPAATAAASNKRETARWKRIDAGTAELQRWIADRFRQGLAHFGPEQRHDWQAMAARMVDAQASALAPRIEQTLASLESADHADVVARLGLLQLVAEGVGRRDRLPPARCADLRAALGWQPDKDEVIAAGEAIDDVWCVVGQTVIELDARLSERRVWLLGLQSRRHALLQDFAHGGRGWEQAWRDGALLSAKVHFYPGTVPLRALIGDVSPAEGDIGTAIGSVEEAIDGAGGMFASNPWLAQVPLTLAAAVPVRDADGWLIHTDAGAFPARLEGSDGWNLMAFSGGHAVGIMGEWDGAALRVLSAWNRDGARWCAGAMA